MVGLGHQGDAVTSEPFLGVVVVEGLEELFQQSVASRIDCSKVGDALEGVGEVASATAREFYLLEHVSASLTDGNLHLRQHLLQVDGKKESGCSTAYNNSFQCLMRNFSLLTPWLSRQTARRRLLSGSRAYGARCPSC